MGLWYLHVKNLHFYTLNETTKDELLLTLVSLFNTSACLVCNNPSRAAFNAQRVLFQNRISTKKKVKNIFFLNTDNYFEKESASQVITPAGYKLATLIYV